MANILVVEDDKDLNFAYCIILRNEGHTVEAAFDGKEALAKLKTFQPQLILLDLLMPVMGGLEFLQQYHADKDDSVKILIFTNMENSPEVTEAYKLGAHRVIIKSWTAPHNLARVVTDSLAEEASVTPKKAVRAKTASRK